MESQTGRDFQVVPRKLEKVLKGAQVGEGQNYKIITASKVHQPKIETASKTETVASKLFLTPNALKNCRKRVYRNLGAFVKKG